MRKSFLLAFVSPLLLLSCDFFSSKSYYHDTKFPPTIESLDKHSSGDGWLFPRGTPTHEVLYSLNIPPNTDDESKPEYRTKTKGDFTALRLESRRTESGFEDSLVLTNGDHAETFRYHFSRREGVLVDDQIPCTLVIVRVARNPEKIAYEITVVPD